MSTMTPQSKPAFYLLLLMLVSSQCLETWSGVSATTGSQQDNAAGDTSSQQLDDKSASHDPGTADNRQIDDSASPANLNLGSLATTNNPETDDSPAPAQQHASTASDATGKYECPNKCVCHKSSIPLPAFIVTCSEKNLSDIPSSLPPTITELYMDNNTMTTLHHLPFLPALIKLSVKHNQISSVSDLVETLPSLFDLDMSYNEVHTFPFQLPQSLLRLSLTSNHLSDVSIKSVPSGSFSNLIELYLDGNKLTSISFRISSGQSPCIFSNLQKLSLSSNKLTILEDRMFACLSSLTAMTISKNHLTHLHHNTFKGLTELSYLDLSSNRITAVEKGTFKKLINLKYLYLKRNQLVELPSDLPLMDWLDVSHNNIERVNETASKEDIYPIEIVNLAHNPLICDCHMLWLKEVWDRREYILKYTDAIVPDDFVPTCSAPIQTADESWDMLSDAMFHCDQSDDSQEGADARARTHHNALRATSNDLDVRLAISLGAISFERVTVHWSNSGADSCDWIFVHYYIFGKRATTSMFAQVEFTASIYVVKNLRPASNYVICIVPKISEELAPPTLDQCVEASTLAMVTVSKSQSWLQDVVYRMMAVVDLKLLGLCFVISLIIVSIVFWFLECFNSLLEKNKKPHED